MTPYIFSENATSKDIRQDIVKNPSKFIKERLMGSKFNFGVSNITSTGIYREQGIAYDFKDYLTKYVYQQYGQWSQIYALNKTNVRKIISGKINKIIKV